MTSILKYHPEVASKLIPSFHPGCRRLTPGDGYLESLQQPNCSLTTSPILRITENGILTSEGELEFDMIVCATGFDTSFIPSWKLVGLKGATLEERWKIDPDAFLAVMVDGMPNYFMFNGPNCPISHGSVLTQVSWTCDFILQWVRKIAEQDIKYVNALFLPHPPLLALPKFSLSTPKSYNSFFPQGGSHPSPNQYPTTTPGHKNSSNAQSGPTPAAPGTKTGKRPGQSPVRTLALFCISKICWRMWEMSILTSSGGVGIALGGRGTG